MEVVFRVVDDVGCHTSKRNGECVEIQRIRITQTKFLKQLCKIFSLDDTSVIAVALPQRESSGESVGVLFFTVTQTLLTHVLAVGEGIVPVDGAHQRIKDGGIISNRIQSAHDAAHTGSCDNIHRNACPFNHFQRSDMRHALGTTATQHHRHLLPVWFVILAPHCGHHQKQGNQ